MKRLDFLLFVAVLITLAIDSIVHDPYVGIIVQTTARGGHIDNASIEFDHYLDLPSAQPDADYSDLQGRPGEKTGRPGKGGDRPIPGCP